MKSSLVSNTHTNNKIIFISSYPKSGNTWLRCMISAVLNNRNGKFDFKDLKKTGLFSREENFKHFNHIQYQKNGNIDFNFLSNHWIKAQKKINLENKKIKFFKTHSIRKVANKYFTDESVCLGFIYIIRDPRDVAISYTHHCGGKIDIAIQTMLFNKKNYASRHKANELISTWRQHLDSWNEFKQVSRLFIKYEDLLLDTKKILLEIINFINNLAKTPVVQNNVLIKNVLESTKFSSLQSMEKIDGFNEATEYSPFFRKGISNQWRSILSKDQINLIENELEMPMRQLGYLK